MSAITTVQTQQSQVQVSKAKLGLITYFSFLIPLVALASWLDIAHIINDHFSLIMLSPAISAIAARLILREGIHDVSFQLGGRRGIMSIGLMLLVPIFIGLFNFVPAWLFGWAQFNPSGLPLGSFSAPPVLAVPLNVLIMSTVATIGLMFSILGEELGWRGFMLTRLISARVPWPIFVSGLIWAGYHAPLILGGVYDNGPNPILNLGVFIITAMSFAYIVAWARLYSGSIWPSVIAHGAFNAVVNSTFFASTKGATYLLGETGLLTAATCAIIALVLYRFWPVKQPLLNPEQPMGSDTPTRTASHGYLAIGIVLIVGGLAVTLFRNYFVAGIYLFSSFGFFFYKSKKSLLWRDRPQWQRGVLIILLVAVVICLIASIIQILFLR